MLRFDRNRILGKRHNSKIARFLLRLDKYTVIPVVLVLSFLFLFYFLLYKTKFHFFHQNNIISTPFTPAVQNPIQIQILNGEDGFKTLKNLILVAGNFLFCFGFVRQKNFLCSCLDLKN